MKKTLPVAACPQNTVNNVSSVPVGGGQWQRRGALSGVGVEVKISLAAIEAWSFLCV